MTIKEAILKSLDDLGKSANSGEICNHILQHKYYEFAGKTPGVTVQSRLGDFIRNGDTRVNRVKRNGSYFYYLTKNEQHIGFDIFSGDNEFQITPPIRKDKAKTYEERDLHKLLSSYLKSTDTYSKTIFHEQSNGKESNQIWTHPDMVGIKFLQLQTKASQNLLKSIKRVDTFKLSSYELKREINSDSELKKAFFQTVSNSSWANYGYLAAFEFANSLHEEMARLNQSFGIGIIEINANPYESKILFPAVLGSWILRRLTNFEEFEKFIEQTEKRMRASDEYISALEKEFDKFCDDYFINDTEVETYCKEKCIPTDDE